LEYLEEQNNAIINGLAGTGKTVMAIEKARRHAYKGEKVLFLCYNTKLKDYLSRT
jgi:KaiC/GvpD/RAD55 family RecA-like ATPase